MKPIRIAQIGVGGMGGYHFGQCMELDELQLVAVCDANPQREDVAKNLATARDAGITVYEDYRKMLDAVDAEAVLVATPHYWHARMAIAALEHGFHVFCEKPPAPVMELCREMLAARDKAGKLVAIHFQSTGSPGALRLKEEIANGALGDIREVLVEMYWFRAESYYERSPWVGKQKVDGHWCLDGCMLNQAVHYINQGLYFASTDPAPAVCGVGEVRADLYRAHQSECLELEDIANLTISLANGATMRVYATTCNEGRLDPSTGERERIPDTSVVTVTGTESHAEWSNAGLSMQPSGGGEAKTFNEPAVKGYMHTNFARAIREGETLYAPLDQAVHAVDLAEKAYQAAGWNIKRVPWEVSSGLVDNLKRAAAAKCHLRDFDDAPEWA